MTTCSKCGKSPFVTPTVVLTRVNPYGEDAIWECSPACNVTFITVDAALGHALDSKLFVQESNSEEQGSSND